MGEGMVGLRLHEALELEAGRSVIPGAFGDQGMQDTVVDEGIAQK
jgi:hypothetical protein